MRILSLVALLALAVPAAATAGSPTRDVNDDQSRHGATCARPAPQKSPRTDARKWRQVARTDCPATPAYPAVVDPLPVYIL